MPFVEIAVVVLLILLNGYFALSELALVSSRRALVQNMADAEIRGARPALALIDDPGRFLSTVQVGITLVGVLAGAFSGATLAGHLAAWLKQTPDLAPYADELAIALVVIGITYLTLIAGELVPKRIAMSNAERIACFVARPMTVLSRLGGPVVWLLQGSTNVALKLLRVPAETGSRVTEEEVKTLIAEGTTAGVFYEAEKDMIEGVLRLADRSVQAVMTPRIEVDWIDLDQGVDAVRESLRESPHSRFPVCRGSIDNLEGLIQAKDLAGTLIHGETIDLAAHIKPPLVLHEATTVLRALELLREAPVHMAVIVDEYGGFEGLLTPNDILSAIAGTFLEPDEEGQAEAVLREDGSWLLDGMMGIDEAETLLARRDMRGTDDDFQTLAGFALRQFGRVPDAADSFDWSGLRFEVVDMDGRRIDKLLVAPLAEEEQGGIPGDDA